MDIPNLTNYPGGHPLQISEQFRLRLSLFFYDHAIITRKHNEDGSTTEHAVDHESVAQLLSSKVEFSTGLLSPDTLFVKQEGTKRTVIEYRKPQVTAIWLDGVKSALHVPLPGLIMRRVTHDSKSPQYSIFAVKERPTDLDTDLYHAPLPNTGGMGVCWGSVAQPTPDELKGTTLKRDWEQLLGSSFNNHQVTGKSKKFPKDIRQMYQWLVESEKKSYPKRQLVKARYTLKKLME